MTSLRPLICATALLLLASTVAARALEQDDLDSLGRVLGATNEAVSRFGEAFEVMKDFGKNDFVGAGTGSVKRGLARGWNEALQPWKDASERVREGLPFKIVGKAFQVSDYVTPIGSATAGDVRGTVSGVTQIVVGGQATAGGAALFGAIGTGAGAVVGSFFPVVGNIVGAEVGGAIGTVAGGFISAYGYDKYLKDYVGAGVEGGFASVFDVDPLQQAMRARQSFLHQNLSPEVADALKTSLSFGGGEAQVLDWERVPYIVTPKQPQTQVPTPATPPQDKQQQAMQTTGNVLAGVRKFSIGANNEQIWEIHDGIATFHFTYPGPPTRSDQTAKGTVTVNRIEGHMAWLMTVEGKCGTVSRDNSPFVFVFTADTVTAEVKPGPVEVLSNPCKAGFAATTRGFSFSAPWKKLE